MNRCETAKELQFVDHKVLSKCAGRIDPRFAANRPSARPCGEVGSSVEGQWLTATEAAHYLKVKPRTLLLWARQGKVTGYPLSGTERRVWRFRQADLDAMLVGPSVPCAKGAQ